MFFNSQISNYNSLNFEQDYIRNKIIENNNSLLWSSTTDSPKYIINKALDTILNQNNSLKPHIKNNQSKLIRRIKSKMPPITEKRQSSAIKGNIKENFPSSAGGSVAANKQFPLSDNINNRIPEIIDFRDSWLQEIEKYNDQIKVKQQQQQQNLHKMFHHFQNHNYTSSSAHITNGFNHNNKIMENKIYYLDDEATLTKYNTEDNFEERNNKSETRRRRIRTRSDSGPVNRNEGGDDGLALKRVRKEKSSSTPSSPYNSNSPKKKKSFRHEDNIVNNRNHKRKSSSPSTITSPTTNVNSDLPLLLKPLSLKKSPKMQSELINFQQLNNEKSSPISELPITNNALAIENASPSNVTPSRIIVNSYHASLVQQQLEKNQTPFNNNDSNSNTNNNNINNNNSNNNDPLVTDSKAIVFPIVLNGANSSQIEKLCVTRIEVPSKNELNNKSSDNNTVSTTTKTTDSRSALNSNDSSGVTIDSNLNELYDEDLIFGDIDDVDSEDFSSDDDDEYKGHAYYLEIKEELDETVFPGSLSLHKQSLFGNYFTPKTPFSPSLFPNVPPYLNFSSHAEKGPRVPPEIQKVLKWKTSNVLPKVVRKVISNSGFRLQKKVCDWVGVWDKHMKSPLFKTIRSHQKFNHIPGSFKIGRKDSVWRNLSTFVSRHGKREFGIMPKTYILPHDMKQLRRAWLRYSKKNTKWIIKPPASARGSGIRVVNKWSQIPRETPIIVQKYLERPLLIQGNKFDLRLYVVVTSVNPLRIFLHTDGLARFASVQYSDNSDTLNDRCMHLTNYSVNKLSSNYSKNEDINACQGHKWTLKSLWSYFNKRGIDTKRLWATLRDLVVRTIISGESWLNKMFKTNVASKYSCFELFGFDVILDEHLVPWLLEVNISPSLHSELELDQHVKGPLVQAVLNTALYQIPPKISEQVEKQILREYGLKGPLCYDKRIFTSCLSPEEIKKHHQFTSRSIEDREDYLSNILEDLTPDDVRCLIIAEDELTRSAPLERIFPGPESYKYLQFIEGPRYYNRLLDAWETRYYKKRSDGIRLLHKLCAKDFHLQVPSSLYLRSSEERIMSAEAALAAREKSNTEPSPKSNNQSDNTSNPNPTEANEVKPSIAGAQNTTSKTCSKEAATVNDSENGPRPIVVETQ